MADTAEKDGLGGQGSDLIERGQVVQHGAETVDPDVRRGTSHLDQHLQVLPSCGRVRRPPVLTHRSPIRAPQTRQGLDVS